MLNKLIEKIPFSAVAIRAQGRPSLSYGKLTETQILVGRLLSGLHISPKDVVGIWLAEGPELASSLYCFGCHTIIFPMNIRSDMAMVEEQFKAIRPKALVVMRGQFGPIMELCQQYNIQIIEIETNYNRPAGDFSLRTAAKQAPPFVPHKNDVSFMFAVGRKIFSHQFWQVVNKAIVNAESLFLKEHDTTLNIPSLTTTEGVMNLLSILSVGGSMYVSTHNAQERFLNDFTHSRASFLNMTAESWKYMLDNIQTNYLLLSGHHLKFIRYYYGCMNADDMQKWQTAFGVPILVGLSVPESLGAVAQNPLVLNRPGSAGLTVQTKFRIFNDQNEDCPTGQTGKIMIRSDYLPEYFVNNPEYAKVIFIKGWFNTQRTGYLDDDKYLWVHALEK